MIKYGLKHIKENRRITYGISSNSDGDSCNENQYYLTTSGDAEWVVKKAELAEWVRQNSTPWYNSEYETPTNDFKPEELEVVKIETIETKIIVSIPTAKELYPIIYKDDVGAKFILKNVVLGKITSYSWYDLIKYNAKVNKLKTYMNKLSKTKL